MFRRVVQFDTCVLSLEPQQQEVRFRTRDSSDVVSLAVGPFGLRPLWISAVVEVQVLNDIIVVGSPVLK